jgi:uncharacterized membrane protein
MTYDTLRAIPVLASDAVSQLGKLIGNEFELARAELSAKASQAGRGIAFIGAGAIILIPALVIVMIAIATAIVHAGLSEPAAYAITGIVGVIIAVILMVVGANRLSAKELKPTVTLDQVQRDKLAAREMMR